MANNENAEVKQEVKKEKSTLVHDSICLFVITLVAGLLLGAVYAITVDPIDKQNEKKKQEAYAAVYDGAEFEPDSEIDKKLEDFNKDLAAGKISSAQMGVLKDVVIEEVMKAKVDGSDAGYVLTCSGKGYGGAVKMALGIDVEGTIKGIQITDCTNETPGLGQNSSNSGWNGQYVGTNASQDLTVVKGEAGSAEAGTISAISGATITSSAVTRAVDGAFQFIASLG